MAEKREVIDPRLDYLYNKNVRCPYCHARILKYTTTCTRCGIHKKQIFEASNVRAKEIIKAKTGEKIFMMRRRPDDVSFTRMIIMLIGGLFGAHCFYVGRRIRGWFFVICTIIGLMSVFIVGPFVPDSVMKIFTDVSMPFPTDFFFAASFVCWAYDFVAVVFGFFKYPVRLGESLKPARVQTEDIINKGNTAKFKAKYGKK